MPLYCSASVFLKYLIITQPLQLPLQLLMLRQLPTVTGAVPSGARTKTRLGNARRLSSAKRMCGRSVCIEAEGVGRIR